MVRGIFIIAAATLFVGCEAFDARGVIVPTGDVVDSRFEQSMSLNGGEKVATITASESYLFYVCADPHIDTIYDNLREFSTRLRNDSAAHFGVVLGDCTERRTAFPSYLEAIKYIGDTQAVDTPIFSLLGNHDLYFRGWDNYSKLLGASVYWFEVECGSSCDLFITLDSASGTLGSKQTKWLREFLAAERAKYRHCFVLTHTNLFYADNSQIGSGNLPLEETAALTELFSRHNITLCLQGHDHYREDLTFGGVRYTIVGTIRDDVDKPEYLKIGVSNSGIEYQWEYVK